MKGTCHQATTSVPRALTLLSGRTDSPIAIGLPCTVCGEDRPLALVAYDAACRIVAVCEACAMRPDTLRDVARIVARPPA